MKSMKYNRGDALPIRYIVKDICNDEDGDFYEVVGPNLDDTNKEVVYYLTENEVEACTKEGQKRLILSKIKELQEKLDTLK